MAAYDPAQTARLLAAVEGKRLHIPVLLAVMCGLRRGRLQPFGGSMSISPDRA